MELRTRYGVYKNCFLRVDRYRADGSLFVGLFNNEGPVATLTKCLDDQNLGENKSYLDTNNLPEAIEFVEENGLGKVTGYMGYSGFCVYPMVEWDMEKLKEVIS